MNIGHVVVYTLSTFKEATVVLHKDASLEARCLALGSLNGQLGLGHQLVSSARVLWSFASPSVVLDRFLYS